MIKAQALGPGELKFGETGSPLEFAVSCTSVEVKPALDKGDEIVVLSGDRSNDKDESYTLEGKLLQSFDLDSLLVWIHVNANQTVPFTFRPRGDKPLAWKGEVTIRRVGAGGDVDKKNESDFEFEGVGMYDLINAETQAVITSYPAPA